MAETGCPFDGRVLGVRYTKMRRTCVWIVVGGYHVWELPCSFPFDIDFWILVTVPMFSRMKRSRRIVVSTKCLFVSYSTLHTLPMEVKICCSYYPIPLSFLYILEFNLNLFSFWICIWYLALDVKQPTINLSCNFNYTTASLNLNVDDVKTQPHDFTTILCVSFRFRCNTAENINTCGLDIR